MQHMCMFAVCMCVVCVCVQVCVHVVYMQHNFTACYITTFVRMRCVKFIYIASFPPPVFDRLQYANIEGEGLGDFVTSGYVT